MNVKRRVFTPRKADDVIRTSVRVSKQMAEDINEAVLRSGHNKRGRSAWIIEVISDFINSDDAAMLVSEEFFEPPRGGSTTLSVSIPMNVEQQILQLLEELRSNQQVKKERSAVIRAALMSRVFRIRASQPPRQESP